MQFDLLVYSLYTKIKDIDIVGHAIDGEDAIFMYKQQKPDILLLDLGLPTKNGLEVIDDLSEFEKEKKECNIVVISGDMSLRQNLLNTKKVYRIIPKPASFERLLDTINEMQEEKSVEQFPTKKLQEILIKLKLNPYTRTGRILIDIIKLCFFDIDKLDNMKQIYTRISCMYSCSPDKIKSSLRSSIRTANRYSSYTTLKSIFFISDDDFNNIISPKQFINGILTYLAN